MKKDIDLYIDMDGVLVSLSEELWKEGQYPTLVPDAMQFLEWAVKKFRCRYLTCWPGELIREKFPHLPKFPVCKWKRDKTEAIDFSRPFFWLEDGCTTDEEKILRAKGCLEGYVYIDPEDDAALTKWMQKYELTNK